MDILLTILSTIVGIVVSIVVSRHYFLRSARKELSVFVQFQSRIFEGVEANLRNELRLEYRGEKISNLLEIQYIIANTGDRAIHSPIRPLTLTVPDRAKLLDMELLHVHPVGRNVILNRGSNGVSFGFDLLNRNDFFIVRCLIDGEFEPDAIEFSIASDDLPPTLKPETLSPDSVRTSDSKVFSPGSLGAAAIVFSIATPGLFQSFGTMSAFPPIVNWDLGSFFAAIGFFGIIAPIYFSLSLIFFIFGAIVAIMSFTHGSFPPPKKIFTVPSGKPILQRHRWWLPSRIEDR